MGFSSRNIGTILLVAGLVACATGASCARREDTADETQETAQKPVDPEDPFPELRAFESKRRGEVDFAALPPGDGRFGPDPYAIVPLRGGKRYAAILRGRDAIVVLDEALREVARLTAPGSPSGLAITGDGKHLLVVGEREGSVARYAVRDTAPFLVRAGRYALDDVRALRDVAAGPEGVIYAVEEQAGRLVTLFPKPEPSAQSAEDAVLAARREDITLGGGPNRVSRVGAFVVVDCLLAHSLVIRPIDASGRVLATDEAKIAHDGPIWGFSAATNGDGLLVAAGGVEDHPLDRKGGFFGYIDSFVFTYRVAHGKASRIGARNVSELGVVTPKALLLDNAHDGKLSLVVTGYGGESMARIELDPEGAPSSHVSKSPLLPGTRAIAPIEGGGFVGANPLLDAFIHVSGDSAKPSEIVDASDPDPKVTRDASLKLGEALFFTTLMAPNNSSEGAHSRFTCETCHFEGYTDGRIHHTGRGEVRVVTKPLVGLFNNRPHFSRALDPDLSSVAHNEFRVAGAGNPVSPWFTLDPKEHPALLLMGATIPGATEPLSLRLSLMSFLMAFTHRTNPWTVGRTSFSALEKTGAERFRDRCESCHEARLAADEGKTRVPFERWESLIFSASGPIVWATSEYKKTGVVPYVHENGARVTSLRRLAKKRPYLTNGSAKDLDELLEHAKWAKDGGFFHADAPEGSAGIEAEERRAIRAFLELL